MTKKKLNIEINGTDKEWYKSKTLWINALAVFGGVVTTLSGELQAGGTITLIGVVNTVLRYYTNSALK